jgi:hypothetical protein
MFVNNFFFIFVKRIYIYADIHVCINMKIFIIIYTRISILIFTEMIYTASISIYHMYLHIVQSIRFWSIPSRRSEIQKLCLLHRLHNCIIY